MKEQSAKILAFILLGKRRYITAAVVAVGVIVGIAYAWSRGNGQFDRYAVTRGTIVEEVSIIGKIKAAQDVALTFESAGTVAEVLTPVGALVHKGDVLARLKVGELSAQRDAAYAKLLELQNGARPEELAQSQQKAETAGFKVTDARSALINAVLDGYVRTESSVHLMDQAINNPGTINTQLAISISNRPLAASITSKRIQLESEFAYWSKINRTKLTSMATQTLQKEVIAEQQFIAEARTYISNLSQALADLPSDTVLQSTTVSSLQTNLTTARTSIEAAASTLTSTYQNWQSAAGDLSVAQEDLSLTLIGTRSEQLRAQEATVREYDAKLDKAILRAPFDGIVTSMEARVGEAVDTNTSIAALSSGSNFEIEAYIPEIEIGKVSVANESTVTLDAYGPDVLFNATVSSIDLTDTIISGVPTYKARLTLKENDPRIRSGMTANLTIRSAPTLNLLTIPARALTIDAGKRVVRVPSKKSGDSFSFTPVSIGKYGSDGMVEVTSGLSVGDHIFVPRVTTP